ncbi:MAG: PASTA domain-containing protein [Lachnospiraceae bacterium]|nr:PASTA domain-containing protein [Lachnospiraceae bacterium]
MEREKKKFGVSFNEMQGELQKSAPSFIVYTIAAFLLMFITALAVFFFANKGYEQVLVPDVTGKSLTRALLEMQEKELYPKLQLRYSDLPGEAGQVISQSPSAGSIVKAGRRITLVVSRGVVIDHVGNYVGMNLDTLKTKLDMLYGGVDAPPITIVEPVFKLDSAPIGTILEQEPAEGTLITQGVELRFIVSKGASEPFVKVPNFLGNTITQILEEMGKVHLLFDFQSHVANAGEIAGTVTSQSVEESGEVEEFSHITLDIALPVLGALYSGDTVVEKDLNGRDESEVAGMRMEDFANSSHGIFSTKVSRYPIAVPVKLDALPPEGAAYTVTSFNHIGGEITVPYSVPHGTVLVLSVVNQEKERFTVQ